MAGNIALRAFLLILIAEFGDKTQLMSMALAAKSGKPFLVLFGAISALAAVTLVGVLVGDVLTKIIPMNRIHQFAGLLFIAIGGLMLFGKI
ncbi:MAG: TMEM165/GDT1 family protein [Armatimonadetes bacterium]|nr:TMEM165/GDT1 family protein [Armatimonadota bacterium]